jgi:proteasome accessory factor B
VDIRAMARRLAPPEPAHDPVTVLVRQDAAGGLRRAAASVEADVPGPDTETRWDRLVLPKGGMALADELLGYGADVYVESPAPLRSAVVSRLRAVVGEGAR